MQLRFPYQSVRLKYRIAILNNEKLGIIRIGYIVVYILLTSPGAAENFIEFPTCVSWPAFELPITAEAEYTTVLIVSNNVFSGYSISCFIVTEPVPKNPEILQQKLCV